MEVLTRFDLPDNFDQWKPLSDAIRDHPQLVMDYFLPKGLRPVLKQDKYILEKVKRTVSEDSDDILMTQEPQTALSNESDKPQCEICKKFFKNKASLNTHIYTYHTQRQTPRKVQASPKPVKTLPKESSGFPHELE